MSEWHTHGSPTGDPATNAMLLDDVRALLTEVTHPAHFFVGRTIGLEWAFTPREEVFWEIFQGQLLDGSQTRQRQVFDAWNIYQWDRTGRSSEPLLSVKLDAASQVLHIVRGIQCYAWEGYHAGDNVYLSREIKKWVRERVGTIDLTQFSHRDELRAEVVGRLFQAVVGVSRLPLTSLQAPLPAFTLGELAYVHQPHVDSHSAAPLRSYTDLLDRGLTVDLGRLEKTKLLETLLRATPPNELPNAVELLVARWNALGQSRRQLLALFRSLFAEVALSPYTDFVDKTLAFLQLLVERDCFSPADLADFLSYLLRQLGRHLTAYDLVTFHHFGANYPDGLLLDAVLKWYFDLIEQQPDLFTSPEARQPRLRRRALRQGWLLRRRYEGYPVPDAPTSPGENARVLPPPHERVPEEQILNPAKRTRKLFANDPIPAHLGERGREVLQQSVHDLLHPEEQTELGAALFVDRPFGVFKPPGEPDQTLLLSYEAFSRSIAENRLEEFERCLDFPIEPAVMQACRESLRTRLRMQGVALEKRAQATRPEPVSLDDAFKVADDFRLLRTTHRAVADFLDQYDFRSLAERFSLDFLTAERRVLIVRSASSVGPVLIYDEVPRKRLEFQVDPRQGYACWGDREYPVAGLRVLRVWEATGTGEECREINLQGQEVVIRPRRPEAGG